MEKTAHLVSYVIVALVVGVLMTALLMPSKTVPVASVCAKAPDVSLSCPEPVINISDTDNGWKQVAIDMATEEWGYKDYRPLFEKMTNIDEREDITNVVVKSFIVKNADSFSQDAKVMQELKVYYEDKDGDDKKAYLKVTTTISDGDIDEQIIKLH